MDWIDKVDIKKIMNVPLKEGDTFFKKELYRYVFKGKPKVTTIIELEYYANKVVVISFYTDGTGNDKTRYKIRHNYPSVVVLRIYQACLKAFITLNENNDYALVFNAADDIGDYKPFNKRMSSYVTFLENYYPNFSDECSYFGYMTLNTFYFHHKASPNIDHAKAFFEQYCERIKELLNEEEETNDK